MAVLMLMLSVLAVLAVGYVGAEVVRSACKRMLVAPVQVDDSVVEVARHD